MTEEQLLTHAARCTRLAETCLDPVVAKKLRALALDYQNFAKQPPDRPPPRPREDRPLEPLMPKRSASA